MVTTTSGVQSAVCARMMPKCVRSRPISAKKKDMPVAEMMIGVTSGEIASVESTVRAGMCGLASPSAARVPSTVASAVAARPIRMLLPKAFSQSSPSTRSYQRSEKASGSSRNIPSVKVKPDSALKLSGTSTTAGAIRNTRMATQTAAKAATASRSPTVRGAFTDPAAAARCRTGGRRPDRRRPRSRAARS